MSPREAASLDAYCAQLELMLRGIEHHSARERDDGLPGPEVAWVRAELGLHGDRLAA